MCLFMIVNLFVVVSLNSTNLLVEYMAALSMVFVFVDSSLSCFVRDFGSFVSLGVVWRSCPVGVAGSGDDVITAARTCAGYNRGR